MDYTMMANYDRNYQGIELPEDREPTPRQNLSIVCGMCAHFKVLSRNNPTRGYCSARITLEPGQAISATHPEQNSGDLACPKVKVICEF
jgi:hypothetical protein